MNARAEIEIRPFVATDQPAARQLILSGLGEHFGHVDVALNPDTDDIAASYVEQGHLFLVARNGDALVGTGALVIQDALVGQIVRVSVDPTHRRHGIGRALVMRLLDAARERGVTRVWMETNDDWHAAIALYRSCGFRPYRWADDNVYMAVEV